MCVCGGGGVCVCLCVCVCARDCWREGTGVNASS